ncbi:hypothetical protein CICLE_v10006726mg [Citrus x clementina]|uniref:Uncharacterized protein n=1 Tax=Citrus clementina TaxID=85681 RepID=V4U2Z1_CITCL|nr:hypothetical protein CICLE_v10006726mg [Citrus x clementina]
MRLAETKHELREHGNLKRSTRQFRVSRVLIAAKRVSSVNKKKKPITQSCPQCHLVHHLQNNSTEQPFVSSSPRHIIFLLIIPLLIGLLQVDYQNKSVSPFDTHPVNMWISFGAAFIYCLGLAINVESKEHQASYSQITSHVILSSGVLASASLASVFFPRLLGWICLTLWTLLPITLGRRLIKPMYQWLKYGILKLISQVYSRFNRLWRNCVTLKNQNLPM